MITALAIDIGGTKISAGYILGEQIMAVARRDYNRDAIVRDIVSLFKELVPAGSRPDRIGISCAGLINVTEGIVRFAGNLALDEFPLASLVADELSTQVFLENDARCAVFGEYLKSRGEFGENVAGLILGTGVGGGLVVGGNLVRGKSSLGGEFGHLRVTNSLKRCACGLEGCLESVAGGRAFEEDFYIQTGLKLTAKEIAMRASSGDKDALFAFDRVGFAIGQVVAQLDVSLDLDTVLVGGGFGSTFSLWEDAALESYRGHLVGAKYRPELRLIRGPLGDQAQLFGAAFLS
jgi:glucokinase